MSKEIMSYKYPPIYKYALLLLVIFLFFKHQKIMSQDKILLNSVIITLIVTLFDYVLIKNHPGLFDNPENKEIKNYNDGNEKEMEDFTDDINIDDLFEDDTNVSSRLKNHSNKQFNQNNKLGTRHTNKQYYSTNDMF